MSGFWKNRRVLVTGHTGFKGSWLCIWLQRLGASVTGFSLPPPTDPSLFELARINKLVDSQIGDMRVTGAFDRVLQHAQPEVVFHLAAQPLVMGGYSDPVGTFDTNVMGTVRLLQAIRSVAGVRAVVNVTTDKCYENNGNGRPFRESDPLGGVEPYGSSKACAELATNAFVSSFFDQNHYTDHGTAIATARAGNVIGGGDWGENRLLPDIVRSFSNREPVLIRRPQSTRPWQHVMDPICGYMELARRLVESGPAFSGGWNFGPDSSDSRTVEWVVERCCRLWGGDATWRSDAAVYPPEASNLHLDCSKARLALDWSPRVSIERALDLTIAWYRSVADGADAMETCSAQIVMYETGEYDR